MQSKKIIEIINVGYFKNFLDLKENNLLLQDELEETYPQIKNKTFIRVIYRFGTNI